MVANICNNTNALDHFRVLKLNFVRHTYIYIHLSHYGFVLLNFEILWQWSYKDVNLNQKIFLARQIR